MGADNLATFHRWRGWRSIAALMPIAVVDRPGWTLKAPRARAAVAMGGRRIAEDEAATLVRRAPPAWVFLHGPRSFLSSTALRVQKRTSSVNGR
jgi:nicotinate-nucleotide adenylyltransferase